MAQPSAGHGPPLSRIRMPPRCEVRRLLPSGPRRRPRWPLAPAGGRRSIEGGGTPVHRDIIPAQEAERIGLVSKVVPADQLMDAAMEMARKIAANPPIALRYMKEGLRRSVHGNMAEMGEYVGNSLAYLFTTEDHKEGAMSFVERANRAFTAVDPRPGTFPAGPAVLSGRTGGR